MKQCYLLYCLFVCISAVLGAQPNSLEYLDTYETNPLGTLDLKRHGEGDQLLLMIVDAGFDHDYFDTFMPKLQGSYANVFGGATWILTRLFNGLLLNEITVLWRLLSLFFGS
ncbi:MAG: hypothetical protein AAF717_09805 [Bacteroidota bacterium]